jgi:hypothetical protein
MLRKTGVRLTVLVWIFISWAATGHSQRREVSPEEIQRRFGLSATPRNFEVIGRGGPVADIAGDTAVAIEPHQYVVTKTGDALIAARPSARTIPAENLYFKLPLAITATEPTTARTLFLQPTVEIANGGLQYVNGVYRGTIFLGLENIEALNTSTRLDPPVQFLVTTNAASVSPEQFTLDHTGLRYQSVSIETFRDLESVTVSIRTGVATEPVEVPVDALRPRLQITASPSIVAGLGIGRTKLTVTVDQILGQPVKVAFTSDRGVPEPQLISVSGTSPAFANLRSSGLGSATVTASGVMLDSAKVTIEYTTPWSLFLASVLGGALGGLAVVLLSSKEEWKTSAWKRIIGGISVGFIVAVSYAIGINLLQLPFPTERGEALFFVLGALGSVIGLPIFDWVKRLGSGST